MSSPMLHHLQLIEFLLLVGVPDSGAVFYEVLYKGITLRSICRQQIRLKLSKVEESAYGS